LLDHCQKVGLDAHKRKLEWTWSEDGTHEQAKATLSSYDLVL